MSHQELAKFVDRIFSYVVRVGGPIGQTISRTQKVSVRRRAEESTGRLENALGFSHERVIRFDVLDRLETSEEVVASRNQGEARHVAADELQVARETPSFIERAKGKVERGNVSRTRAQQETRAVAAAARRIQNMGAFSEARRPSVPHDVLMPEPRRGPAVEREAFH